MFQKMFLRKIKSNFIVCDQYKIMQSMLFSFHCLLKCPCIFQWKKLLLSLLVFPAFFTARLLAETHKPFSASNIPMYLCYFMKHPQFYQPLLQDQSFPLIIAAQVYQDCSFLTITALMVRFMLLSL